MKKYKILFLLMPFFLLSCEDWLDVTPSDQVSEDELFSSSEGFRNSLIGIYKDISTTDMYAKEMSWGFVEALSQNYDLSSNYNYGYKHCVYYLDYYDGEYQYGAERTMPIVENLWAKPYNAIANCNNLIKNLDNANAEMFKDGMGEDELNLIKGEAFALRAFLHFDLLRLFAASPKVDPNGKYIPYCNKFPSVINEKKEVNTVLDSIISDLEKGERLTMNYDTLRRYPIRDVSQRLQDTRSGGSSDFLAFRGYRLHYYAIRALKARAYLYKGDFENARKEARFIMDQKLFRFSRSWKIDYGNTKLYDDIIFALYNKHLTEYYEVEMDIDDDYYYSLALNHIEDIYDVSIDDPIKDDTETDCRYQQIKKRVGEKFLSKKYLKQGDSYGEHNNKMIPILRYSEVILIYAECMYDIDKEKAKNALAYLRSYRDSEDDVDISSKENFMKEIQLEYQREFIGEGQMFYFYKRLNRNIISNGKEIDMSKNFIVPVPDIESINN